jgi:hypothetical protein
MKYKVGDKVRIKSIDWYNENKNKDGIIDCGNANFIPDMVVYCGDILTISTVNEDLSYYYVKGIRYAFKDEMIEGLVEETKPEFDYVAAMDDLMGLDIERSCINNDYNEYKKAVEEHGFFGEEALTRKLFIHLRKIGTAQNVLENFGFNLPDGYIFKDENGNIINATKIVLEKKKKEYPKTYEECIALMHLQDSIVEGRCGYEWRLISNLQKLLLCCDAYWKIAGEEMGLDKPWEPDWEGEGWYVIINHRGDIVTDVQWHANAILAFPTEEMRDTFYENFKELIEQCKELL